MPDEFDDRNTDPVTDGESIESTTTRSIATPVTSIFKVLGEIDADSGVGVLGQNNADSGTPIGVQGAVPNNSTGYGLATPDDARVEGALSTLGSHEVIVNGNRALKIDGQGLLGGNFVAGYSANTVRDAGSDAGVTIGGGGADGDPNVVTDRFGTVSGGSNNRAGDDDGDPLNHRWPTVGGGHSNTASGKSSTIAGGNGNLASGNRSFVGGGGSNTAGSGNATTVAGGSGNKAIDFSATAGGGFDNVAAAVGSVVAGGQSDRAFGRFSTIGGGTSNRTGVSGTTRGQYATVPGGTDNVAREDYSFAAGRRAKANHEGSFVWADSTNADFTSTANNQFIVRAQGGVGINENSPTNPLHVTQDSNESGGGIISGYTVRIDHNVSTAEGLAIKSGGDPPSSDDDFIAFFDANDTKIGEIQGNGSGGVEFTGAATGDFAEFVRRSDPDEAIEPADVVGVFEDGVTKRTDGADGAMVVSDRAIVTGNSPGGDSEDREEYETVAFVGQVPAKVRGPVEEGDLILASGRNDGTARAVSPSDWQPGDDPLVGRAWEGTDQEGVSEVAVAVGIDDPTLVGDRMAEYRDRIDELEAENEQLRERLAEFEDRLAAVEPGPADSPTPADD